MSGAVFPPCCLTWDQTIVEVMKIMVTSFWRSCAYTATLSAPTLQQATADSHLPWRLLDTHREFWVSLLWGHGSILLGSGACKILSVPSKSLFPQSYVNSVIKSRSILPIYLSVPLFFFFFLSQFWLILLSLLWISFQVDCLFPCPLFCLVGFYCVPSSAACFSVFSYHLTYYAWSLCSSG